MNWTWVRSTKRWNIARAAVLCAALGASLAAADARDSYRNGMSALDNQRPADAESYFRQAIAERGEERSGGLRRAYLPHFYLGVALAEQSRCREALAAWDESESQQQVQKVQEAAAELLRRRQRCRERIKKAEDARVNAEQAIASARKAGQNLARVRRAPELAAVWEQGQPSFSSRDQAAVERLDQAAYRLDAAKGSEDPAPYQEIRNLAVLSGEELDELTSEAEARRDEIRSVALSALDRLESAEKKAYGILEQAKYLKPYPAGLKERADALERSLAQTASRKATAAPGELASLHDALTRAGEELRKAAAGPPRDLRTAAAAYLAGRPEEALTTLEGQAFRERRANAQACLLRAASRHALFVLEGEQDAETAAALRREVLDCQALQPASEIKAKFFSPRFINYYENPPELENGDEPGAGLGNEGGAEGAEESTDAEPAPAAAAADS